MANSADFTYTVGFQGDATNLSTTIQNFSAGLKSKPLVVPIAGGNLDVANSAQLAKVIEANAQGLTKITIKMKEFGDAAGNKIMVATKAFRNMEGQVGITSKQLDILADKAKMASQGYKETGKETDVSIDFAKINAEYAKSSAQLKGMTDAAQQFMAKSRSMSGAGVDNAKATAQALIDQKKAYDAAYGSGQFDKMKIAETNIRRLNEQFKIQEASTKRAATGLQGWANTMATAVKQTIAYTTTLGTMRMAQQLVNDAIQFTIELNKEMVAIQVLQAEGAQTPEEIQALAGSFNDLAKQMGVTTNEVAKGSVEWLRQGRTIAETTELLKSSTMLSKLGALESAEATELLTSTVNSYKIAVEDTVGVVDKMVAVDNNSATSTREIATALRYTAATAAEAGVSLDKLISYIATMSSVTRINAESIGQSMKTMLTRMQDIKAGKIDEDGLGLNNVESALSRINVKLRDTPTSFRDLGAVLEDVAAKWSTLNDIEQANIAKAIAGVRQANLFKVLMANMGDALKYQGIEANAAGTAMDRYAIYLQGVEAAQNKLKASVEHLYMDAIQGGAIITIINLGTKIVNLVDDVGGLTVALTALGVAFLAIKWNSISSAVLGVVENILLATTASEGLTASLTVLNIAFLANPVFWLAAAFTSLIAVYMYASTEADRLAKKVSELNSKLGEQTSEIKKLKDEKDNVYTLTNSYNQLNNTKERTIEQNKELADISSKLLEIYPSLQHYYDNQGNLIISETINRDKLIEKIQEEIDKKLELARLTSHEMLSAQKQLVELEENRNKTSLAQSQGGRYGTAQQGVSRANSPAQKRIDELTAQADMSKLKEVFISQGNELMKLTIDAETDPKWKKIYLDWWVEVTSAAADVTEKARAKTYTDAAKKSGAIPKSSLGADSYAQEYSRVKSVMDKIAGMQKKLKANEPFDTEETQLVSDYNLKIIETADGYQFTASSLETMRTSLGLSITDYNNLTEAQKAGVDQLLYSQGAWQGEFDTIEKNNSALQDVSDTYNQYGEISLDQTQKMIEMGYAEALMYDEKTGKMGINVQLLHELKIKEIEKAIADAQAALAEAQLKHAVDSVTIALANQIKGWQAVLAAMKGGTGFTMPTIGGGGGGGGGGATPTTSPEIEAQEAAIKAYEKKKKKLQDALEAFKKYIAAQKESLKLQKEENDYNDKIADKNKQLAKLKTEIMILSLDKTKKAEAQRLKLEDEAAKISTQIKKEEEDRKYDLQVQALDAYEKKYEEMIDKQIAAINRIIDKINDLIEALKKALALQKTIGGSGTSSRFNKNAYSSQSTSGTHVQGTVGSGDTYYSGNKHSGGLVESHHNGDFAGNLKSNEVYAKLLMGEYVATEGQMNNFMKNILPKIASEIPTKKIGSGAAGDTNNITFSLSVNGNLDKVTLADVKREVFDSLNKATKMKGKKTNAMYYSI